MRIEDLGFRNLDLKNIILFFIPLEVSPNPDSRFLTLRGLRGLRGLRWSLTLQAEA